VIMFNDIEAPGGPLRPVRPRWGEMPLAAQ
jgi:hypothetical protein